MAAEQLPLLFFKTSTGADPLPVARALAAGSAHAAAETIDPDHAFER